MSSERKPHPHMEKQVMPEPQEEFIGDEAQPSKDISEMRPEKAAEVKPATPRPPAHSLRSRG